MERLRAGAIRALLGRGISAADVAGLRLKDVRELTGGVHLPGGRVVFLGGAAKAAVSRWGGWRRRHLGAGANRRAYLVSDTGARLTPAEVEAIGSPGQGAGG